MLINCNVSNSEKKEIIYANSQSETIKIPDDVTSINSYVFMNNKHIKTIDLNRVEYIGNNSFMGSSIENIFNENSLNNCNISSFAGTPWMESQNNLEEFVVGNVLIAYYGTGTKYEIKEGIKKIGDDAFKTATIQNVILPESVEIIGVGAFNN